MKFHRVRFIASLLGLSAATFVAAGTNAAARTRGERPAYTPDCPAPQAVGILQPSGGADSLNSPPAIAFNGRDYAMVWVEGNSNAIRFRRFYADGTPAGPMQTPVSPGGASTGYYPALVWNGTEYGLVYATSVPNFVFVKLNSSGVPSSTALQLNVTAANSYWIGDRLSVTWSGTYFAAAWAYSTAGSAGMDIFVTVLDATGAIVPTLRGIDVSQQTGSEQSPTIVWSAPQDEFFLVYGINSPSTINYAILNLSAVRNSGTMVGGTGSHYHPALTRTDYGYGLVWSDNRDGAGSELYFAVLNYAFNKVSAEIRLTNDVAVDDNAAVVWTGLEYGVFFQDNRSGVYEIWYQRVDGSGQPVGAAARLTASAGLGWPVAAFNRNGYLLATGDWYFSNASGPVHVLPVGCVYDYSPPTCGAGYVAYNITGTTATIAWTPSDEPDTDLAYYNVYRNGTLVGQPDANVFSDSGLGLSTTYNYVIQPVNSAQMRNTACTQSLFVKTNASLTLTLSKANPDAVLLWTDAGISSYSIFRGTSPQVMQQINATPALTASDSNALVDNLNYFYTVDDPGP